MIASLKMSSELFFKEKNVKIFLKHFKTFFVCSKTEYLYLKKILECNLILKPPSFCVYGKCLYFAVSVLLFR